MRTSSLAAIAATALLAFSLAGCAPTTDTSTEADPDDTTTEESDTDDSSSLLVLPGTGEYESGDSIPIGGYQLTGEPAEQPAGCTWTLYTADGDVFSENQGSYVFITDVTGKFVTSGCPDWEQFE